MFKLSKAQSLLTLALLLGIGVFVVAPVVLGGPSTSAAPHQSGSDVAMVVFATAALILAILATIFAHRRLKL